MTPEEHMERTILKCITYGLVFVNSKSYPDAFQRLMEVLMYRYKQTDTTPKGNHNMAKLPLIHRTTKDKIREDTQESKNSKL